MVRQCMIKSVVMWLCICR